MVREPQRRQRPQLLWGGGGGGRAARGAEVPGSRGRGATRKQKCRTTSPQPFGDGNYYKADSEDLEDEEHEGQADEKSEFEGRG